MNFVISYMGLNDQVFYLSFIDIIVIFFAFIVRSL